MTRPTRSPGVPSAPLLWRNTRLFLIAIATLSFTCKTERTWAQQAAPRAYVAQILGLWSAQDEKSVAEALAGWEAIHELRISLEAHRLKFFAVGPVDEQELNVKLSGTGTSVFWLAEVRADGSFDGDSYDQHAFPVLLDTGDPAADNARYDADKAAWFAAHPGWVDVNSLWDREPGQEHGSVK